MRHLTVWTVPDALPWATSLFELYQMPCHEPPHCLSYTRCPTMSHLTVWAIPDVLPWATSLFELYQMSYHEPPHCLSYTRCPTMSHLTVWTAPDVLPWTTSLFQLYQMPYQEPPHWALLDVLPWAYTRCPTMSHLTVWAIPNVLPWATSLFELYWVSFQPSHLPFSRWILWHFSRLMYIAALITCDWLVFWVRCCLASTRTLLFAFSESGYWGKSHSENRNRPDKWRLTTKCN